MTITDDRLILPASAFSTTPKRGLEMIDGEMLGLIRAIEGSARGTNTQGDVLTQTADGRDLNGIWSEFLAVLNMHNERRTRLVNLLTFPVQQPIEDVPIISGDNFEEASEFGEPKGLRSTGEYHSLGYDFKWYDLGIRYTWMFLAEASAQQVESLNNQALEADNRLVFSKVLRAIFNNANRIADIRGTAVNVYPFYNGDGTVPPSFKNYVFTGTHNHYLTSGAAVVDSGDLDDMEIHLRHHGYGSQQGATLLLLANSQDIANMRSFRVANGDSYDFIPAAGTPPALLPPPDVRLQGAQPPAQFQGLDVAGRYGKWLVIEEDYMPAGYMLGFATGGEMQATNPVGIRQHVNAGLRGLRLVKGRVADYPLIDSFYQRGFGTGVRHRGAGIVMQITANPAYTVPADYA